MTPDAPRCALCGRLLTDQASIIRGLGRVCARRVGGKSRPRVAPHVTPGPRAHRITGQLAIPIQLQLPEPLPAQRRPPPGPRIRPSQDHRPVTTLDTGGLL